MVGVVKIKTTVEENQNRNDQQGVWNSNYHDYVLPSWKARWKQRITIQQYFMKIILVLRFFSRVANTQ